MIEKKLTRKEKAEIKLKKKKHLRIIGTGITLLALLTNHLDGNQKAKQINQRELNQIPQEIIIPDTLNSTYNEIRIQEYNKISGISNSNYKLDKGQSIKLS
jgi:hypothetical protein